ncbi:unnamed protein product [Aphanomyces euteiches]
MQLVLTFVSLFLLISAATAAVEAQFRVPIKVIFRAFCPACKWYITDPVLKLMQDDEFRAIVDLQYIPAGAMTEENGELKCYGGPAECEGQLWMACIIDRFKTFPKDLSSRLADKIAYCFKEIGDFNALQTCKSGSSTNLLRSFMAIAQKHEGPWQPYTIVEDKVLGSATAAVTLEMLQTEVCKHYKGPGEALPKYCKSVPGVVVQMPTEKILVQKDNVQEQNDKVKVQVIWRAYCPACKWYLSDPIYEVLRDPAFQAIIDFEPYPSGSTKELSPGQFQCAGGASECVGHQYLSCALHLFPDLKDVAENLKCLEDSHQMWDKRVQTCFSGSAHEQMRACFASEKSKQYLRDYIKVSVTLETSWVPLTIVAGNTLGSATTGVGYDMLTKAICDAYRGPNRPKVCAPLPTLAKVVVQAEHAVANQPSTALPATTSVSTTTAASVAGGNQANKATPVMPCRQKEKGFVYEDAPDIGPRHLKKDGDGVAGPSMRGDAPKKLTATATSSVFTNPMLLPVLVIGAILVVVFRYSKDEKKKI